MNNLYYFFDCKEPSLNGHFFSIGELHFFLGKPAGDPIREPELVKIAKAFEASLYRYEKNQAGQYVNKVCLYDPETITETKGGRTAEEYRYTCSRCGQPGKGFPAIIGRDKELELCPDCGIKEAIEN